MRVELAASTCRQCRMRCAFSRMRKPRMEDSDASRLCSRRGKLEQANGYSPTRTVPSRHGLPSMTRAAEKIHLSPGAVSLQLHNLADELHTELFVRRGKRLLPTPAALRLAERAKEVVRMMGHIQQEFENDLTRDVRPFHFATGVTTLIYQL